MKPNQPIRMFIYQPIYTVDEEVKNKEYLNTKTYNFPYYPAKKGDVFTTEKRVKEFIEMQKHSISKVVSVSYNLSDGTCGVVLADKTIERKEEPAGAYSAEETKEEIKEEIPAS
jgi:hypothetical protein